MTLDEIPEAPYQPKSEPDTSEVRNRYWKTAFGLQAADGLEPSGYARELAQKNVEGTLGLPEVGRLLRERYRCIGTPSTTEETLAGTGDRDADRTPEADLVSHRIVEVLESESFILDPLLLNRIHRRLFQDLAFDRYRPGVFKTEQLIKPEVVLNGDSVLYAPPATYEGLLRALFAREALYEYGYEFSPDDAANFAAFIAKVWQVHPFAEGNTRTVAAFAELYLNDLGFETTNEPFEAHAAYFRDALVRANYRNRAVRVEFDRTYLEGFFEAVVHGTPKEFDRRELLCCEMFDHPEALRNASASDAREVRSYLAKVPSLLHP